MSSSKEFHSPLVRKAFELAYALFRLAELPAAAPFQRYFHSSALEILDSTSKESLDLVLAHAESLSLLVRFAGEVQAVSSIDAEILQNEIGSLKEAIRIIKTTPSPQGSVLSGVFKEALSLEKLQEKRQKSAGVSEKRVHATSPLPTVEASASGVLALDFGPRARQTAIFEKIKQIGNCRLSDIQAFLPDVSERTIRYDIQSLVDSGIIERIGNSGPATFYRLPKKDLLPISQGI